MHRSPIDSRLPFQKFIPRFANESSSRRPRNSRGKDSSRFPLSLSNLNPSRLVTRDLYISDRLFSLKDLPPFLSACSPSNAKAFRAASWLCSFSLLLAAFIQPCAEAVRNQSRSRIIVPKRRIDASPGASSSRRRKIGGNVVRDRGD